MLLGTFIGANRLQVGLMCFWVQQLWQSVSSGMWDQCLRPVFVQCQPLRHPRTHLFLYNLIVLWGVTERTGHRHWWIVDVWSSELSGWIIFPNWPFNCMRKQWPHRLPYIITKWLILICRCIIFRAGDFRRFLVLGVGVEPTETKWNFPLRLLSIMIKHNGETQWESDV